MGPSRDTAQGEKRRFYKHNFDLGAAAKPVSKQETPNWQAFSVGGQIDATAAMASKGRQCTMADCESPARFFLHPFPSIDL
jgi:hypothetical protein